MAEREKIVETGDAAGKGHKRLPTQTTAVDVVDDLPTVITPVPAETDAIENYLGKAIDALLSTFTANPSNPE